MSYLHVPAPTSWSAWNARSEALADLRALPGLAERIRTHLRAAQAARRRADTGPVAGRPDAARDAQASAEAAYALAHPHVVPHFPHLEGQGGFLHTEVRGVAWTLLGGDHAHQPKGGLFPEGT